MYQVLLGSLLPGVLTVTLLVVFLSSAIENLYSRCFLICSVFLIMSPVTATTTTAPVIVVHSGASPITTTVIVTSTSKGLAAWYQHVVVLVPQLILMDTMKGSIGPTTVPQQQPQSWMPSQEYASNAMKPGPGAFYCIYHLCYGFFLNEFSLSELSLQLIHYFVCWCLLWCLLSAFRSYDFLLCFLT